MKTYQVTRMHTVYVFDFIDAKDEINALEKFKRRAMNGKYNEPSVKEYFDVEEFDNDYEADEPEPLIEIKNEMTLDEMFDVLRKRRKVAR